MRKLYEELLYVPKHGKVRENVMVNRVVVTVLVMLFCLCAMSFSAYAYFSYNVISPIGVAQGAVFETAVSVQAEGTPVEVINSGEKSQKAVLEAGKTYTVTVTPVERSTASTGYMIITTNTGEKRYHTQQIAKDGTVTFYIKPTVASEVTFEACWGTSVYYAAYVESGDTEELYITAGEMITLTSNTVDQTQKTTVGTTVDTTATTIAVTTATQTIVTTSETTTTATTVVAE